MGWHPRSERGDPESESGYDALHEGVPEWLRGSLINWVREFLEPNRGRGPVPDMSRLREVERRLRIDLGRRGDYLLPTLLGLLEEDEELLLDLVDLVAGNATQGAKSAQDAWTRLGWLDQALGESASAWRVAVRSDDIGVLERRVDETVTEAAREVMGGSGRAGAYLAQAWVEIYGREPSPGEAYRHAIRAVEAAVTPVVIPDDPRPTLGRAIGALRDAPQKWRAALSPSGGSEPIEAVRHMLELLWKSQWDRHGIPDDSMPLDVSPAEATAAVHLATTLVQWFTSGAVEGSA